MKYPKQLELQKIPKIPVRVDRLYVSRPMVGLAHMQVCAVPDVTNQEILDFCNSANPSGTSAGWTTVVRRGKNKPRPCDDDSRRIHILVGC